MSTSLARLVRVVKFKALKSQLNDAELIAFLQDSKEILINMLCDSYFHSFKHSTSINRDAAMDELIASMEKIIQCRKRKDGIEPPDPQTQNVDRTASSLEFSSVSACIISEIASYLKAEDYVRFSRINRRVFVATNSPNTLQFLQLWDSRDHSMLVLSDFHQLRKIQTPLSKFESFGLSARSTTKLTRVRELLISNEYRYEPELDFDRRMIARNPINFTNIKKLSLLYAANFRDGLSYEIMQLCPMIECLDLHNVCPDQWYDESGLLPELNLPQSATDSDLKQLFPHLLKLKVVNLKDGPRFAQFFASQLQHLEITTGVFDDGDDDSQVLSGANFGNLQSLEIEFGHSVNAVNAILSSAKNLQRIKIATAFTCWEFASGESAELAAMIQSIFAEKQHLNVFAMESRFMSLSFVMNCIHSGLCRAQKRKADALTIGLSGHELETNERCDWLHAMLKAQKERVVRPTKVCWHDDNDKLEQFIMKMKEIIDAMRCVTKEYRFCFVHCHRELKEYIMDGVRDFVRNESDIHLIDTKLHGFMVGTQDCEDDVHELLEKWVHPVFST